MKLACTGPACAGLGAAFAGRPSRSTTQTGTSGGAVGLAGGQPRGEVPRWFCLIENHQEQPSVRNGGAICVLDEQAARVAALRVVFQRNWLGPSCASWCFVLL